MGLFDAGRQMLSELTASEKELVTLVIDGVETPNVRAQPARCKLSVQAMQAAGQVPVSLVVDVQDWLIEAADYTTEIDSETVAVQPKAGDRLISDGNTFEVLPIADTDECFYYRDNGGTLLRLHSKRVSDSD